MGSPRARRPWWAPSWSLMTQILAINMGALAILALGLLYLDQHQDDLFEAKISALTAEGELIAGALGGGAMIANAAGTTVQLDPEAARGLLARLVLPRDRRAKLFAPDHSLIVDSRTLAGAAPLVETEELPDPARPGWLARLAESAYLWIVEHLPPRVDLPPYHEDAFDHPEYWRALEGESGSAIEETSDGSLMVTVAVPVQHFKQVQAVLMLGAPATDIEHKVRAARFSILEAFAIALTITVLLSLYLAGTIARPVRRLARAAEAVRARPGRKTKIPDFTRRRDEIGELSGALRDMTNALWERMDAIEQFAADVAHEIKNPLSSVRSAIETLNRVDDPAQRERLMAIILDDVQRLDRLISDISDASRLDAELSRAEPEPVDLKQLLSVLAEVHATTRTEQTSTPHLEVSLCDDDAVVPAIEDRLVQVVRNLLANAESFSPPGGRIGLALAIDADQAKIIIEDDGPGIPPDQLERIFERFYSLRPEGEKFGIHSGLGLSISRQIVETHGGRLIAENRTDEAGHIQGARITLTLPRRGRS
jgi:two-component system sensor histidine kinase ChvG